MSPATLLPANMNPSIGSAVEVQEMADEQRGLLDLIDKLQFAQLDNVKLPQIVVVGDQSAGKSSVLEAITGTPFPRDAGACTRFATEIRLRRSNDTGLSVKIIPDRKRTFNEQERFRQFGGSVDANTPFDTLMRMAVELIAPKNQPGRFAASDILVVEKKGPDLPLLTLVDLPGLVKNANNDQSLEDIRTIEALSDRYMKSSRTIILAVVGGNSDYVQAPILSKARQFDPTGARTIGVLTKPDLTESIGLEDKFIELVQNRDALNIFRLGWFVLLNPGPREPGQPWPSASQRRQIEDNFFSRGKWSTLPESMCGVSPLKQQLSVQLQRHIGKHVKVLRAQIQKALDDCEAELKSLGAGKDTIEEMRVELGELFSSSNELVLPAVYGFYKNPPRRQFFRSTPDPRGTPAQNLCARAIEENERFAHRIRTQGRKHNFTSSTDPRSATDAQSGKQQFAKQEVEMLLRQFRGPEFPMDPKPRAVYMLFQSYSEKWPKLAQEHKDNLGVVCNEFLNELIDYAWPKRMREPLWRHFIKPQMRELLEKAQGELDHLAEDINLDIPPYDPEYAERLRKWHADTTQEGAPPLTEAEEVLEKMLIYYDLSAKGYIRNVITQVVERHLLRGIYGVFNSAKILGMSNQIVEAIAAENKETRDRRQTLRAQKKAIEEAKEACANLTMRKELRQYAGDDLDDSDETSDDEGPTAPASRTAPPRNLVNGADPASPKTHRDRNGNRTSRRSREDTESLASNNPYAPAPPADATPNGGDSGFAPLPRISEAKDSNDYYNTYGPPKGAAPAPPPRPDKVRPQSREEQRAAEQQQHYTHAARPEPVRSETGGTTNGYVPAEYSRVANERLSMRKILGRA